MDVLGFLGFIIGVVGIGYGIYSKLHSEAIAKGSMLGAEEGPEVMILLSQNGYGVLIHNQSKYPHFDIWVRVYDFATDKVIDPTVMGPGALGEPMIKLGDLYPNQGQVQPFFEIDLRQRDRARVNLFIHTRNAQSTVEIVAIREGEEKQVAYKQWFSENKETMQIPDDFPVVDRENPASVFGEDEPTGTIYMKTPNGLVPFPGP